ncbi:MAG: hypothetical protein GF393_06750 [Armatimonadia bacterium]|nr:hypothetical protein [Armatimonadia bacterium]
MGVGSQVGRGVRRTAVECSTSGVIVSESHADRKQSGRKAVMAALSLLAALVPAAVWVLQHVPGEEAWIGAALVYAPTTPWIVAPAVGLLLALAARRWSRVLLSAASIAFAVLVVAGYQLNEPAPIPPDRPIIRLATWNVYGWTDERELVQDRIMSWDCDVVCLQEAARPVFRDLLPGYDSAMAADLRVYVRGKVLSAHAPPDPANRKRRMLICEVETDAGRFTVVDVHIPRAEVARRTPREFEPLIDYIMAGVDVREQKFGQLLSELPTGVPLIVAGDLNTPPPSRYYDRMDERFTDSFAAVGRGFGNTFVWRRRLPILRIDYVWTGGGVAPLTCTMRDHRPSDHRPLVAELALPRSADTD